MSIDWSEEPAPTPTQPPVTDKLIDGVRAKALYWAGGATIVFYFMIGVMLFCPSDKNLEAAKTFAALLSPWMTIIASMVTFYFAKR